jgi:hypothetical protein
MLYRWSGCSNQYILILQKTVRSNPLMPDVLAKFKPTRRKRKINITQYDNCQSAGTVAGHIFSMSITPTTNTNTENKKK